MLYQELGALARPGLAVRLGRLSLGLALAGMLAGACASEPAPAPAMPALADELIFYNWPEDMPQSVLETFTAEYGVTVDYQVFDTMEAAVADLEAGQVYDVVNLDNRFIPRLIRAGRLAELDHARLPNLKNISPSFRDLMYDPGNRYTVPYNWGTTGLVIRPDRLARPATKWSDLWDPQYAGRVALWLGQPREVLGLTLRSLGFSANSENPAELEAALARLSALKPNARWLDSEIDSLVATLESGEVVIGMGYAGDVLLARASMPDIAYVLPEEGALLWGENFVIPSNSPRQATAEAFLNFILRADIAAQIANENFYATPNEAAFPLIQPEIFNEPVIFPPNAALQNAEIVLPLSPDGQALFERIWAAFLAAP
jgi:spermidine/putrescine transport system substrate-binding protein